MMNRSGIETYELLRLDEVALAGYFDLEDTRFEEWYEKNRAVGDRLYSAILDRKIDLVAFRGTEDGRYYSILTRSPKQEGSLQLTDIDSKGPIGHRRLKNPKNDRYKELYFSRSAGFAVTSCFASRFKSSRWQNSVKS